MLRSYLYRTPLILTISFALSSSIAAQERADSAYRMVFYNTENLFDNEDDTLTDDDDFLPGGVMRWNYPRYRNKINSIYKVIAASGNLEPPVLVGLCEIENRKVLEELIYNTYLSHYNYAIVHGESNDPRGIDVGIIYRQDIIDLIFTRQLIPAGYSHAGFRTRNVLYAKFLINSDTIHLFLNHWPSRRGGALAGEDYRRNISEMIKEKADSINKSVYGKGKIIVAGDFNCTPNDTEMGLLMNNNDKAADFLILINLAEKSSQKGSGTYKYMGTWEMLDQVIVSENLLKTDSGIYTGYDLFSIFSPDFLLAGDPAYPGFKPFSTYSGYRYQGGFSDHLPVTLDLKLRSWSH